jgi:hypothetical protein
MATLKTRNLKKQDRLDKDIRINAEHPHAFRKNWPKKKARANRVVRHREKLVTVLGQFEDQDSLASDVRNVVPAEKIRKSGVMTLREWIQNRKRKRAARVGHNARMRALLESKQTK